MQTTERTLFQQIVASTQRMLRLQLKKAQGDQSVHQEIEELAQAIAIKQALLDGQASSQDGQAD